MVQSIPIFTGREVIRPRFIELASSCGTILPEANAHGSTELLRNCKAKYSSHGAEGPGLSSAGHNLGNAPGVVGEKTRFLSLLRIRDAAHGYYLKY